MSDRVKTFFSRKTAKIRAIKPWISKGSFDGLLRIYPTLECNLSCPYCVNEQGTVCASKSLFAQKSPEEWSRAINRIGRGVVFTGGEPTLYRGFYHLLNLIDEKIKIILYSNLNFNAEEFIDEVQREIVFYLSYHPSYGSHYTFIENYKKMLEAGRYQLTVHAILWMKQKKFIREVKRDFNKSGIPLILDSDQMPGFAGCQQKFRVKARCRKHIILIAPDGTRYQCVSKLIRQVDPRENIIDVELQRKELDTLCNDYGFCAACDALGETKIVPV